MSAVCRQQKPSRRARGGSRDELSRSKQHDCRTRLQPLDGAAGSAVRASVHRPGLCIQRVQSADDQADRHHAIGAGRLEAHRAGLDLLARDFLSRRLVGRVRPLGRGRRSAPRHVHRRTVLGRRLLHLGVRRLYPQSLGRLSRLRRDRRLRPRHRLHLAGLDADQMVSRPARHGDRHGHHGLRRRRLHRLRRYRCG